MNGSPRFVSVSRFPSFSKTLLSRVASDSYEFDQIYKRGQEFQTWFLAWLWAWSYVACGPCAPICPHLPKRPFNLGRRPEFMNRRGRNLCLFHVQCPESPDLAGHDATVKLAARPRFTSVTAFMPGRSLRHIYHLFSLFAPRGEAARLGRVRPRAPPSGDREIARSEHFCRSKLLVDIAEFGVARRNALPDRLFGYDRISVGYPFFPGQCLSLDIR